MRTISVASLAKLATHLGTEPVCIVEVQWQKDGALSRYSDKAVEDMEGRILQLASLEDIINVSRSGTSQSIDITLDDTDGELKQIFNNVDIHKKKVWVYQWFTGIPVADKFLLFVGVIASPVTWKEGDRTLSFSVISSSEDHEVGFSPEEGSFPSLPQGLIGTAWPLVFGSVKKLPTILIDNISYSDTAGDTSGDGAAAVTTDGTGIKDPSLDPRIDDNDKNAEAAAALAKLYFSGYLLASFTARKRNELDEFDSIDKGKGYFSGLAKQYLSQGNAKLKEAQQIRKKTATLKNVRAAQERNQKKSIGVTNGELFEQGRNTKINLGGALHEGHFLGNSFVIASRQHPQFEQYQNITAEDPGTRQGVPVIPRQNYFYADAAQPLKLGIVSSEHTDVTDPPHPVRYIVAATIQVNVGAVFAYKTTNGQRSLAAVPYNYYVKINTLFGTLPVTLLWMQQPLSSRILPSGESEGWDDEVWASCTSPIGPNTVDILIWLITTYTGRTYDITSFAAVRTLLDPYPMHFALQDRPNVLSLIQDISYQARCIVWLKNDVFFIKYLAQAEAPVDTITEEDVIEMSAEVSYTETEDLVTKYVAHWRADYKLSKNFAVILRYNIAYYGLLEKEYSYFCFNMIQLVQKAATFWLIREANTFKKLKITVPMSKLNIETLDTVTLDFNSPYVASVPIDCVVEEAKFNSSDYTIDLLLWVPVRAGEMTKYTFAYMGDLEIGYFFPSPDDISSGRAGGGHDVPYNNDVRLPDPGPTGSPDYTKPFSGDPGNGGNIQTTHRPHTWGVDPTLQTDLNQIAPEILQRLDATAIVGAGKKPDGTTAYLYEAQDVKDTFKPDTIFPRTFPGYVVEKDGTYAGADTYTVEVYMQGFGADSKIIKKVVFAGPKNQKLQKGSGVLVSEVFVPGTEGKTDIQFYMQGSQGSTGRTFPGQITGGSGTDYIVDLYREGTDELDEVESVNATQLQIDEDETIPEETWVLINELVIPDDSAEDGVRYEYYIQVPVWL